VKPPAQTPPQSGAPRATVAVIGAGFSGVLTAVRLLRAPDGPRVLLIERGPRFGRGAAYATGNPHHLLNVRGANMSAFPEAPSHFLDWLGASAAEGGRTFVTRETYGQYLQSLLREAAAESSGRLVFEHDGAVALERDGGRWSILLAMGRRVAADAVVLAIGNLPPSAPEGVDEAVLASPRWVADPWAWIGEAHTVEGDVLLIGSGLTAVDVALAIEAQNPGAAVLALSRHGLAPQAHAESPTQDRPSPPPSGSPSAVLEGMREALREDWRGTIDGLRPHVQTLWRSWDLIERRRFLRHLRPWWEVGRHRLAPQVEARLAELRGAGQFAVAAGRLVSVRPAARGVEVRWAPRGGGPEQSRQVCVVVNCTGPLSDVEASGDPLVGDLMARGLARPDACRLGVEVDEGCRVVGRDGASSAVGLFAVGPLTRGEVYEMTSVPDIRVQAGQVAAEALAYVARTAAADGTSPQRADDRLSRALLAYLEEKSAELDLEIDARTASRRVRGAWELRGRRAALDEIAAWLEARAALD
jgi:uncharacterized NAD(P)/FAD-binding protein YdhS